MGTPFEEMIEGVFDEWERRFKLFRKACREKKYPEVVERMKAFRDTINDVIFSIEDGKRH